MLLIGMCLLELFVAFDLSKAFGRIWHAGLLQKLHSYGITSLSFLSNRQLYLVLTLKKKNFMTPIYRWDSTASRLESLRGGSLLFTTKFPEISGTHFIDLGRMKG